MATPELHKPCVPYSSRAPYASKQWGQSDIGRQQVAAVEVGETYQGLPNINHEAFAQLNIEP